MPLGHIEHFLLQTTDMAKTRDWYVRVLGLQVGPNPDFKFPVCWLYLGERDVVHLTEGGAEVSENRKKYVGQESQATSGSGVVVNPRMESLLHPGEYARRLFFLNAGCAHESEGSVDLAYVERMHNLVDGLRPGVKLLLFAFERTYGEDSDLIYSSYRKGMSFGVSMSYDF